MTAQRCEAAASPRSAACFRMPTAAFRHRRIADKQIAGESLYRASIAVARRVGIKRTGGPVVSVRFKGCSLVEFRTRHDRVHALLCLNEKYEIRSEISRLRYEHRYGLATEISIVSNSIAVDPPGTSA